MSVKMKRVEMISLWNLLNTLSQQNLPGRIFKIFTSRNILVLKPEIELIQETFKAPEGAKEFEEKKRDIYLKYADRDSNNAIIFENNQFKITKPENVEKANAEVAKLEAENSELVEEIKKVNEEFDIFAQEKAEYNLMKLTESGVPDEINNADLTFLCSLDLVV